MQERIGTWLSGGRDRWNKISGPQQIALVAGVVITVALIVGFVVWSRQPSYSVLFSNLQSGDSSAIVAQLKSQKIPYQLQDGGSVILVPSDVVDDTRLTLAGNGLPNQGVVGFEIFDKSNPLGMTDFMQQMDYQRGLQGELTRTIQQMAGVSQAWVNIVLPQSSLYTTTEQDATASITIKLKQSASLSPAQVKSIMHLVASSVQGLKPDNVTVIDTSGNNLSDLVAQMTSAQGVTLSNYGNALDVTRSYEQHLSQQATSMLTSVLGPGKAVVRVNASLNWDEIKQDSTVYGQQPGQVADQTTNNITSTGQQTGTTTGAPGTGSNLVPTPTPTTGSTSGTTYNQTQSHTVYNVSQTVEHIQRAPGSIERLSVAVFIDGQYPTATVTQIQNAVANAIGVSTIRGDQISVAPIAFNHDSVVATQAALTQQQQQSQLETILRGIALVIAALALIFFAFRATRQRAAVQFASAPALTLVSEEPSGVSNMDSVNLGELPPGTTVDPETGMIITAPESDLFHLLNRQMTDEEIERSNRLKQDLLMMAHEHPDMLSNVIIFWFNEQ
jgi:flagellar M-ring protein FliF